MSASTPTLTGIFTAISAANADPLAKRMKAQIIGIRRQLIGIIPQATKFAPYQGTSRGSGPQFAGGLKAPQSADFWPVLFCGNALNDVRFGSKADIAERETNVRFTPKSAHG